MTGERPYIGLRYFEEADAHLFYGRDENVAELLVKLAENRFVAVLGSSGSGKSSLVRAGLLPELRSGMIPVAGPRWKVVEFKPGRSPLGELGEALRVSLGVAEASALVEEGPLGIVNAIRAAKLDERTNVLLIADQFEEVFRFQSEARARGREAESAEQCLKLVRRLLDAASQTTVRVYVLLVMRSDYLGECAQFPELPERMSESLYLVPRLRRDQLQEAIEAPAGGRIEPAVVQRLLAEVGSDPDQLPRLQHLLGRMWDRAEGRLTMPDYDGCGGWETGLDQHLEEVFVRLDHEDVCRRVFQRLSELDRGRAVRRRADLGELTQVCGPEAGVVVAAFRAAGFLAPVENPVDITHECILREWTRLKQWLLLEDASAKRLRELSAAAADANWRPGSTGVRGLEGLTLQTLIDWRDESRPSESWAGRYLTAAEFDSADGYLTYSQALDQENKVRMRELERQAVESTAAALRRTRWMLGLAAVSVLMLGVLGWRLRNSLQVQEKLTATARARGLVDNAAAGQFDDPARALYVGWKAVQMERPMSPALEAVLNTALTNGASYGILRASKGSAALRAVAWSPDGKSLASASGWEITVWDVASSQPRRTWNGTQFDVYGLAWSPDGKRLASAGVDSTRVWEADTAKLVDTFGGGDSFMSCVAWSPNGRTIAIGEGDGTVTIWDPRSQSPTPTEQRILKKHRSRVTGVSWRKDGLSLASASDDGTIWVWDLATGQAIQQIITDPSPVRAVAWNPIDDFLASARNDGSVNLIRPNLTGQFFEKLEGHQDAVLSVAWSPDGKTLASAGSDWTVQIWDVKNREEQGAHRVLRGHTDSAAVIAWSPDGKSLASASADGTIRLWDASAFRPRRDLAAKVLDIAWSRDGTTFVAASGGGELGLWDAAGGRAGDSSPRRFTTTTAAWSPDRKKIAFARPDHPIEIHDAFGDSLRSLILEGQLGVVTRLDWSPSGSRLASTSSDTTIKIWDAVTGRLLKELKGGGGPMLAWSPDEKFLASTKGERWRFGMRHLAIAFVPSSLRPVSRLIPLVPLPCLAASIGVGIQGLSLSPTIPDGYGPGIRQPEK